MRRLGPNEVEDSQCRLALGDSAKMAAVAASRDPLAEMQSRRDELFDQAREQGRAAGLRDARSEIERQVNLARAQIEERQRDALAALEQERKSLRETAATVVRAAEECLARAESLAAEVAFAAVTRLLGEQLDYVQVLSGLCGQIIREFGDSNASLRVGEHDHALLSSSGIEVPLVLDRRLNTGQCVLDTPRGQLETGLDVRLEALKQALLDGLERAASR